MGNTHTTSAEPADCPEGVGQQLRKARESSRISIVSVSASLRLPPRVIVALEEGDFGQFEPVYVRGYLRNYARLLNLAAEPLIESYNHTLIPDHPPAQPQNPTQYDEKSPLRLHLLLAMLGLAFIMWGAGKAFRAVKEVGKSKDAVSTSSRASGLDAQPPTALPSLEVTNLPNVEAVRQPSGLAEIKPEPASDTQKAAVNATPAPTPVAAPALPVSSQAIGQGPDSIVLHLSAGAWVSIRDQNGRRLVYENLPAGTDRAYAGQAPFAVVLGNSPATKIEFNGQPYEQPKSKAGTVARFRLGPASGDAGKSTGKTSP